jgi:cbb3-type cytochrome oxidase subunit 3
MSREPFDREAVMAWRVILFGLAAFWIGVIWWALS